MLVIPAAGADVLVMLPGFMIAASSYTVLARSVADAGSTVIQALTSAAVPGTRPVR